MELEQFDWAVYAESVKAGTPRKVVTRDGNEVTQLMSFEVPSGYSLRGVLDGVITGWHRDGKAGQVTLSHWDLFFAPKTRTVWHVTVRYAKKAIDCEVFEKAVHAENYKRQAVGNGTTVIDEFTREVPA